MKSVWIGPLAALTLWAAAPAFAQDERAMAELRRNCTADYSRLCSAYAPDSPDVRRCFAANRSNLSPRCAETIAKQQRGR